MQLSPAEQKWFDLIQEARSSGLNDKAWCLQYNVPTSTFYYHVRKLRSKVSDIPAARSTVVPEIHEVVKVEILDDKLPAQLKIQGKTEKDLQQKLGMSNGAFTAWKYKNVKSYLKRIDEIAEYLDVDKSYLLEGRDDYVNINSLTGIEVKLIKTFRSMGNEQQRCFIELGVYLQMATMQERAFEAID